MTPLDAGEGAPHEPLHETAEDFAARCLGPRCQELLSEPAVGEALAGDVSRGRRPADAVLALVKERAQTDAQVNDELAAYVLPIAMRQARALLAREPFLRPYVDTTDLANSVVGNLWPQLDDIVFEREAQFVSLIAFRLKRKIVENIRRLKATKRSEDRRDAKPPEELVTPPQDRAPAPEENAQRRESVQSVIDAMERLSPGERRVFELWIMERRTRQEIAEELGLSYDAVRVALKRALSRIREYLGDGFIGE